MCKDLITGNTVIHGKTLNQWIQEAPVIKDICTEKETEWINPKKKTLEEALQNSELTMQDIQDASARLDRFASYFQIAFPETKKTKGILESPVQPIPSMQKFLEDREHISIPGKIWIKLDSNLPISGSIKARGGIYEVLKTAEDIALEHHMISLTDDYAAFASPEIKKLLSQYSIGVGSTGNLGLSIGIISAALGFHVTVHMSADARQWKKDLLRSKGVIVKEYKDDYSVAVKEGRELAKKDPMCHFVDDENSQTLFLGYSVAALRLQKQFAEQGVVVDQKHPLLVYLPCGVGGGPGGVAFGLKMVFGDACHCFFAEPTHSCCMMLGMATGLNHDISVQEFDLDNRTAADGLAVGRASGFVGKFMAPFMSGCYSLTDDRMYKLLAILAETENIKLEPSALAGMQGPVLSAKSAKFKEYFAEQGIADSLGQAAQLVWATGGSMVPPTDMAKYIQKGQQLLK